MTENHTQISEMYPLLAVPPGLSDTIVIKRNGSETPFDGNKILKAILSTGLATQSAVEVTHHVLRAILVRHHDRVTVEQIQDLVVEVLQNRGYADTAVKYAVYRDRHAQLRSDKASMIDVQSTVEEYLSQDDWRVKANANQGYSLGGLIQSFAGKVSANYWLDHVYSPEAAQAHRDGDIHIHDLDMLSAYCIGHSLRQLLAQGVGGPSGKVTSKPPKHLSAAIGQMVNFLGTLQNEAAGAQAFSSFDTLLAPFVRKDGLTFAQVKQSLQEFVFAMNQGQRFGAQPVFSNLTFDWNPPADLADQIPTIAGVEQPFTYGDLQAEMDMINLAFIEVMTEGDAHGRAFTFPIPTYNITPDFNWDHPNCEHLFEMTAKYGTPYFQNFLNSDLNPDDVRSMCCRLQLDLKALKHRGGGLFGASDQTGSIGVVTINMARLGYLHSGEPLDRLLSRLLAHLDELLVMAKDSLEIKRKMVTRWMDQGLYPYAQHYIGSWRNFFSTIGVNGMHEMIVNLTSEETGIQDKAGKELAELVLDHINSRLIQFQEETGHLYNLEATPAEGTTYRFAREDKKRFPDIVQAGTEDQNYYTNSSQLPAGYTDDPFVELEHQESLQSKYTGGTVLHLYMTERMSCAETAKQLVKRALSNYRVPYLTITPMFSICPEHGYLAGEQPCCPVCGGEVENWTRVMGYHRPVSSFNNGKKGEHNDRRYFPAY